MYQIEIGTCQRSVNQLTHLCKVEFRRIVFLRSDDYIRIAGSVVNTEYGLSVRVTNLQVQLALGILFKIEIRLEFHLERRTRVFELFGVKPEILGFILHRHVDYVPFRIIGSGVVFEVVVNARLYKLVRVIVFDTLPEARFFDNFGIVTAYDVGIGRTFFSRRASEENKSKRGYQNH